MYYTTIVGMTGKHLHYITLVCFHLLVAVVPLYFRFTTEELFEFNKLILVYALTAIITGLWVTQLVMGKVHLKRTPFDIPIALFFCSQVLSTLFSIHPRTSWLGYYTRFHGGLLSYSAYILLYYAAVHIVKKKQILPLLITTLASAGLVSLYGILEHFGHSASCLLITDGAAFDVNCWIQDVQSRVFATFGQPNWLAAYAIMVWPIAAWLSFAFKRTYVFMGFAGTIWTLLTLVIVYTKSRSGFLGLLGGIGLILFFTILRIIWKKYTQHAISNSKTATAWQYLVIGLILQTTVILFTGTPFTPSISTVLKPQRAPSVTEQAVPQSPVDRLEAGGTDSGEIRKIVWAGAIQIWKRYPLLGSGVETFAYSYYRDRPTAHNQVSEWDFLYNKAHNEWLNFLATTGSLGALSFTILVGSFFVVTWKMYVSENHTDREQHLAISLAAGVFGLMISNFFGFSTVMVTVLWFLYQAFLVILYLPDQKKNASKSLNKQEKQNNQSAPMTTWLMISLTWFFTCVALILIYRAYLADTIYTNGKSLLTAGQFIPGSTEMYKAIRLTPGEALYYDELAHHMAKTAVEVANASDATTAARIANTAVTLSETALSLNNSHLNFYKTRTRIFITLAQLQPDLLEKAKESLLAAIERAPTDAKLVYNLALVELGMGGEQKSMELLENAISLKPNYGAARLELAKQYIAAHRYADAQAELTYILEKINPGDIQSLQLLEDIASRSAQLDS